MLVGYLCFLIVVMMAFGSNPFPLSSQKFTTDSKSYRIRVSVFQDDPGNCTLIDSQWVSQGHRFAVGRRVVVFTSPQFRESEPPLRYNRLHSRLIHTVYAKLAIDAESKISEICQTLREEQKNNGSNINSSNVEIKRIRSNGPSSNRIDVVLMGDGYTLDEREQFFADMERLTDEMFTGVTFASYLPVFNIWAVHNPSQESGIGVGGQPRNTAFQLYRDGTELRGIYCGNPSAAVETCKLTGEDACDFPSLIGNDDYYGGLGGQFVIGTKSHTTGTVVLRHEMGHNFVKVGEEYDDGSAYYGVNSANSLNVGWKHWLSDPSGVATEEQSIQRIGAYPWHDLATSPVELTFQSNGNYRRWFLRFTASGCEESGTLVVYLDGEQLNWQSGGTLDRTFYTFSDFENGFSQGQHVLRFVQGLPPHSGNPIRQLCSVSLIEYMDEPVFHFDNDYVSAYPTWDFRGTKRYRPTNEACLMRNMSSENFCPVCQEGMWMQFFSTISLIDEVTIDYNGQVSVTVNLATIALGQLRNTVLKSKHFNETLRVSWYQNDFLRSDLDDTFTFSDDLISSIGEWDVVVKFETNEVRYDPNDFLTSRLQFSISLRA